tara:strand:+ start:217 stop:666 length:450 start_codon:yes stop_codon:yes gene_type:complete
MLNVTRKIVGVVTLGVFSLFIGCEDNSADIEPIEFELLTNLQRDDNGYYHMKLDPLRQQTFHRLSGRVTRNDRGVNVIKFGWGSDTYYEYQDYLVPIVNGSSYSDTNGEVNTVLGIFYSLLGDTATIYYSYYDNWLYETNGGEFSIIFN